MDFKKVSVIVSGAAAAAVGIFQLAKVCKKEEDKRIEQEKERQEAERLFQEKTVACANCKREEKRKNMKGRKQLYSVLNTSHLECIEYVQKKYVQKYGYEDLCPDCYDKFARRYTLANGLPEIECYPATYKGRVNIKPNSSMRLTTRCEYENREEAEEVLRCLAFYEGKNVLTDVKFHYENEEDGNYIYKVWSCSGLASILA